MSTLSSSASFPLWRAAGLALLALVCLLVSAPGLHAQATVDTVPPLFVEDGVALHLDPATPVAKEHGIPQAAPRFDWELFGFIPVNNSMIITWIVALGLIGFAQYSMRHVEQIPSGAQNFWEFLVESLRNFLESVIGRALVKKTFWFFATIFIFILATNWCGLLPGIGTCGWGEWGADGDFHVLRPLFRGANADLNMTLAMSIIFFALWILWAIQSNGFGGAFMHIFGPKGKTEGFMKVLMVVVFALVGILEVVSILFRPISLSFRLYGNIFAGENMLEAMSTIAPNFAWLIPIPFYFMELLVGIVQALVFMLLTAVFTLLICSHGEEPHAEEHGHH